MVPFDYVIIMALHTTAIVLLEYVHLETVCILTL